MGSQGKSSARAEPCPWLIQLPHFQHKEIMKRRKRQDRLGPGTYNIKGFLQETRPTSSRGIGDTRGERFRDAHRDCLPGPGTYGNPYIPLDERDKRSASTKGMMDSRTAKCALVEAANVMGPGSYNPKPIEKSACNSQAPSWSTAKRFNRNFYHLFTGNENPVGAGRCDTSKHEKYPQKKRYQSLYQCDAQRYLSNLKRDASLLERLKPVAKTNWCDLISAPRCPDTSEEISFPKVSWCWKAQISE